MENGILIGAAVALVAVIGLVFFGPTSVGNTIVVSPTAPSYSTSAPVAGISDYQTGEQIGEVIAERCLRAEYSQQQCCSEQCTPGAVSRDMFRGCSYVCQLRVAQAASAHIDEF